MGMSVGLPVAGFATHLKVPVDIEEIYIPLRAMVNLKGVEEPECYGDAHEAEKQLARCDAGLEIPLIEAFSEAGKRGRRQRVTRQKQRHRLPGAPGPELRRHRPEPRRPAR